MKRNGNKKAVPVTRQGELPIAPAPRPTPEHHYNWGSLAENLVVCHADLMEAFFAHRAEDGEIDLSAPATMEDALFCVILAANVALMCSDVLYLIKDNYNNGYEISQWASGYNEEHRAASIAISEFLANNT